ncbi:MAG: single-stranded-DNA-specific exonuclease RecJ [Endomicrobiales bacterium]|nr:single-stranded-DNA-specific exonuclease RecJ [Endomicrobiales bacterium]
MDNPNKNWKYKSPDLNLAKKISEELQLSDICSRVIANRGIASVEQARAFLNPDAFDLHSPFLLEDAEKAVSRIRVAINKKEKILIYGDRDVDGVTSICIMVKTLESLGADVLWYIPSIEGYGLHKEAIDAFRNEGVSLIITVDCGITSTEESKHAKKLGVDLIITDHHEPPLNELPDACAVVNPKRADSKYPFSDLAGCSVSFKVAEALMLSFGKYYNENLIFFDIKTTGTDSQSDRIEEISSVKTKNGLILDKFFQQPGPEKEKSVLEDFLNFISGGKLVINKNDSTLDFLKKYIKKQTGREINQAVISYSEVQPKEQEQSLFNESDGNNQKSQENTRQDKPAVDRATEKFDKFSQLMQKNDLRMNFFKENKLDMVSLGTIADIMPLLDENRIIVKKGLEYLKKSRNPGIQSIINRCRNGSNGLSAKFVSWNITPILNSAGRFGKADLTVKLLLTKNNYEANEILDKIIDINNKRKRLQAEYLEKFLILINKQCDVNKDKILIAEAQELEHGVTGIIASQIVRRYNRPVILFIKEGKEATGAARSVEGFDVVNALHPLSDILIKYGGHAYAAGLTISLDKIDEFRKRMRDFADKSIRPETLVPSIEIDAELELGDINNKLLNELLRLEPFGSGNPNPVFSLRNVNILENSRLGNKNNHLKLLLSNGKKNSVSAIGWNLGHISKDLKDIKSVDLAAQLEQNMWNGRQTTQLNILDIKPSMSNAGDWT